MMGSMGAPGSGAQSLPLDVQVAEIFASFAGPKLWIDPSKTESVSEDFSGTIPITNGTGVGRISDLSGGGNHIGQATAASRPLWQQSSGLTWLQADGIANSLYSLANFDCTSTDKITVLVGVRKISDAARGVLMELGNGTLNGFLIDAPTDASTKFRALSTQSGGNPASFTTDAQYAAPISAVLVATGNWSAPAGQATSLEINGVNVGTLAITPTGGTLPSAVLHLFRRNNATFPFAGGCSGLMIFGGVLSAQSRSICRSFMAQKTGVVL